MTERRPGVLVRRRVAWLVCAGLLLGDLAAPTAARAQASEGSADADQARSLLKQGSSLYLARKYEEALDALKRSYDIVRSPNSALLIARCLRELGRPVEAQEMFAAAEVEAKRRATEGSPKYAQTAESAKAEGAAVRSALGSLRIRIEGVEEGPKVEIDGAAIDVPPEGDLVVWHAPGEVNVTLRSASGLEQKQTVTVRAGAEVAMGFGRPEPPPVPEPLPSARPVTPDPQARVETHAGDALPPSSAPAGGGWAKPAAFVFGAVTLVGAGMFAGFGLASHSEWQTLWNTCGSSHTCGSGQLSQAQTGKNEQIVANASLIGGCATGVATIVFAVVAASGPAPAGPKSQSRWRPVIGATSLGVAGEFP
jgi:hypothetical protein